MTSGVVSKRPSAAPGLVPIETSGDQLPLDLPYRLRAIGSTAIDVVAGGRDQTDLGMNLPLACRWQ